MPKKFGINTKKQEANERKMEVKKEKIEKEIKKMEDEYWRETDEKILNKIKKEKDEERKRQEQIRKKQEREDFLKKEEEEMYKNKKVVVEVTKGSAHQHKEKDLLKLSEKFENVKIDNVKNEMSEIDIDQEYVNENFLKMNEYQEYILSDIHVIEGNSTDSILKNINLSNEMKHPEKKMRSAWNDYVEKNLPELKKQYPKFKRHKLLDMLSKDFHKSSDNPMFIWKQQKQREQYKQQLLMERNEN